MIELTTIKYFEYTPNYRDQVIKLLVEQGMTEEKFTWRYERAPYSNKSLLFLATFKDRVIGFRGLVQQKFKSESQTINVFSPCDAFVDKGFRRIGLMTHLNMFMIDKIKDEFGSESIILNLSSNEYSTPGYLKQGWVSMDAMKQYLHKVSLAGAFNQFLYNVGFIKKRSEKRFNMQKENEFLEIRQPSRLIYKDLVNFNFNLNETRITNNRDEAFYNWRYSFEKEKYLFVLKFENSQIKSYVILQKASSFKYFIAEYASQSHIDMQQMLNFASCKYGIPYMTLFSLTLNDSELQKFKNVGFMPESWFLQKLFKKQRLPALVRLVEHKAEEKLYFANSKDIRNYQSWNIQFSDVH
ncbi:hypothetical protein QA597_11745 [Marinilabiliaceae bacterium ANBcel2]|nr:hypothetical protein [Marinilabiliaceae bacterium ANBcel2]